MEFIYANELGYAFRDPSYPMIIRNVNWTLGVRCYVERSQSVESHMASNDTGVGSNQGTVNNTANYNIVTEFYSDANFRQVKFDAGWSIAIHYVGA